VSNKEPYEPKPLPPSLWAATAEENFAGEVFEGETTTDVAIVGGGFCGLSAALHLAKAGVATTLLEANAIGWGASGRNGGQVIPCFKDDPETLISRHGPELGERMSALGASAGDLVVGLIERYGICCNFRRDGWVLGMHGPAMRQALEERTRQWQARHLPVRMLDRAAAAALLGTDAYEGAYLDPRGGALNPLSLARGLARAAGEEGARIYAQSPVLSIVRDGSRWRVDTPGGTVRADKVLVVTGAYSGALRPELERSVLPVQSIQIATRPLPEALRAGILPQGSVVSDTRRLLHYFRFDAAGRFVFGGRGSLRGDAIAPAHVKSIANAMTATFPQLAGERIEYTWAGHVDITADRQLRVHELAPGLVAVLGLNGRGVALAPAIGRAVAIALTQDTLAPLPLPVTDVRPVPFHGLRLPAMALVAEWYRLRDHLETGAMDKAGAAH
jgi:glycine/D-amino acid oxidase-like deaminating enzyme